MIISCNVRGICLRSSLHVQASSELTHRGLASTPFVYSVAGAASVQVSLVNERGYGVFTGAIASKEFLTLPTARGVSCLGKHLVFIIRSLPCSPCLPCRLYPPTCETIFSLFTRGRRRVRRWMEGVRKGTRRWNNLFYTFSISAACLMGSV